MLSKILLFIGLMSAGILPAQEISSFLSPPDPSTHARLIVYRPPKLLAAALSIKVRFNSEEVLKIPNGALDTVYLPAGQHLVSVRKNKRPFFLDLEAGQTYYFRTFWDYRWFVGHGQFLSLTKDAAKHEIIGFTCRGKMQRQCKWKGRKKQQQAFAHSEVKGK